ncbi:MAG: hypothetical protein FJ023_00300 [Chloroflexi bacterium]|nr:hypothetical protein [Chloroflexota bacterium]
MEEAKYAIGQRVKVISAPNPKFEQYVGKSGVVVENFAIPTNDLAAKEALGLSGTNSLYFYAVNIDGLDVEGLAEEALQP